ncbi:helix-turn-helix domain-containing protein [Zhouia sp. PK063]|uniref:helix-turn-helix domain-containing protein n=1 Tax=Zhouia sp. PK063 TaxID=3373602 RepID=UPI00379CA5BB
MHLKELGERIKQHRNELRVTLEYLSEVSGTGLRTLKQIETGKGNPTFDTLQNYWIF